MLCAGGQIWVVLTDLWLAFTFPITAGSAWPALNFGLTLA